MLRVPLLTALAILLLFAAAAAADEVGGGDMVVRTAEGSRSLPRLETALDVRIDGPMVHATLRQSFSNPTDDTIEAIYLFPMPENASVHHMEMRVGDRVIVSRVEERRRARAAYLQARDEGRKAALVEQERANLFTASVANVNPGERIDVVLELVDEVRVDGMAAEWVFPLTLTPRFTPSHREVEGTRVRAPFLDASSPDAPRASFRASVRPGATLARLDCPSHDVRIHEQGDTWEVVPVDAEIATDRDVVLRWEFASDSHEVLTSLLVEGHADASYALLTLVPPPRTTVDADGGLPTDTVFVLDVSGSMAGPSIEQARAALVAALDRLRPGDRFEIIAFNDEIHPFAGRLAAADPTTVGSARRWATRLEANHGTMIFPALREALDTLDARGKDDAPSDEVRVARVVFLTDGAVSNEAEMMQHVARGLGPVRLHTIGIGAAPNRALMRDLARTGGGACTFVAAASTAEDDVDRFLRRLTRPVWTDVEIEWVGADDVEVTPQRLPVLHAGEALIVSARTPSTDGVSQVLVRARGIDGPIERRVALTTRVDGVSLSQRWARRRVGELLDSLHSGASLGTVRPAVVALGTAHHLVTPYTSLVAEERRVTAVGTSRAAQVPNALPRGSRLGVLPRGGTSRALRLSLGVALLVLGGLAAWHARCRPVREAQR